MLRIVLADDNIRAAAGLARVIHRPAQGYTCCGVAHDGRQALALALECQANVVITDVRMPVMNGLELSRRLREALPGVSIIIISAYDEFEYARSALAVGVDDYILKPLDRDRLREITAILERINGRLARRAEVLGRLGDPGLPGRLRALVTAGDAGALSSLVGELLSGCAGDFACARDAGASIVAALRSVAEQLAPASADGPLTRVLEELEAEASVAGIAHRLSDAAAWLCASVAALRERAPHAVIDAVTRYLEESYTDPGLAIGSLPSRFRVSASWLHHAFRSHTRTTPNAYLTDLRLANARRLLEEEGADVAEAARRSGYRDPHYFARAFRRRFGLAPSDWRRRAAGGKT
jgi:two-component system response regulator YesN